MVPPHLPHYTTAQAAAVLEMPLSTIGTWAARGMLHPLVDHGDAQRSSPNLRASWLLSRDAIRAMSILRAAAVTTSISEDLPGLAVQAVDLWKTYRPHVTQLRIAYTSGPDSKTVLMVDAHLMRTAADPTDWVSMQAFNLDLLFGRVDAALDAFDAKADQGDAALTVIHPDPAALVRA